MNNGAAHCSALVDRASLSSSCHRVSEVCLGDAWHLDGLGDGTRQITPSWYLARQRNLILLGALDEGATFSHEASLSWQFAEPEYH